MSVRVLLVDDQPLMLVALGILIGDTDDLEVVGQAGDGREAVRLARELRPDVVVMDIRMPGMDGIEATRQTTAEPDPPITMSAQGGSRDLSATKILRQGGAIHEPYGLV